MEKSGSRASPGVPARAGELDAIFDAVTDAIVVYDSGGSVTRLNAAARALFGGQGIPNPPPAEPLARMDLRGGDGAPLPCEHWPHSRILRGETLGGETVLDVRLRAPDGRELELSVSGAPICDKHGHITGAVTVYRDVTTLKQQASQAEEAGSHLNDFLSLASHELRNPLTSIRASIQLAERRLRRAAATGAVVPPVLEAVRDPLERGERQTSQLDRLVGDLLDVSRIQSGRLELRMERVDLTALLRDATEQQRASNPGRHIALELPGRAEVPVRADPDRIIQVVTNYLNNALKYSADETPVAVRLALEPGSARVTVRDEGPGIPEAEREHIWERFHRTPGAAAGEKSGLGLGLFISRGLIERHGGQVGVESAPGQGSIFWFTLPLL